MNHRDFRQRQKKLVLDGLCHLPLSIAYTDLGDGEPVLLLHGIPTWSYLYHDVIPLLAPHCRVLAPDFLGHGYSDRRDRFDRSLRAQTRMILGFLDALGLEKVTIVGHDTGGGVALIMGIEHPERVARLVLTNVVAYDSWPIDDMIALGNPNWRSKSPQEVAEFVASGLPDGLHNKDRLTAEFREGIVAPYSDEEGKISLIRNASALNTNHTTALIDRHASIRAPTLVLWGVHDPWQTIRDGESLAREIPGARLVRIENASHWLQQDTPEPFARGILDFLKKG
ncbi:MAG: alpha/beta fold hydrolase [Rhodospirillaceae bacterium]|nr:alpha/beta fold hydrolase [Rhodospirillaceae bacterium]